jgi:ABC-type Mn2+/Zn2+ transport system ATPase subunit
MELSKLEGKIIGICQLKLTNDLHGGLVKDMISFKYEESMQMVGLSFDKGNSEFKDLSLQDQKRVILASKLQDSIIVLDNFFDYFNYKDQQYFKLILKRIASYGKKIIIIESKIDYFLNFVDTIYFKNDKVYKTNDFFDDRLYVKNEMPKIVKFSYQCGEYLDKKYTDLYELIKAIYRGKKW